MRDTSIYKIHVYKASVRPRSIQQIMPTANPCCIGIEPCLGSSLDRRRVRHLHSSYLVTTLSRGVQGVDSTKSAASTEKAGLCVSIH
jgi:hypothetical protein